MHSDPEAFRIDTSEACGLQAPAHSRAGDLRTGLGSVDLLLRGSSSQVIEVVGPPASGKTALCCGASAQAAQLGPVVYIDTKAADIAQRVRSLVDADQRMHAGAAAKARSNIFLVGGITSMEDLLDTLVSVLEKGCGDSRLRLLVIDCFADLAAPHVHSHPRETGLVSATSRLLSNISTKWDCCVLAVNTTVRGDIGGDKPALKATYGPMVPQRCLSLNRSPAAPSVVVVDLTASVDQQLPASASFCLRF